MHPPAIRSVHLCVPQPPVGCVHASAGHQECSSVCPPAIWSVRPCVHPEDASMRVPAIRSYGHDRFFLAGRNPPPAQPWLPEIFGSF